MHSRFGSTLHFMTHLHTHFKLAFQIGRRLSK